jgi:predicted nucleic acid-binding protein
LNGVLIETDIIIDYLTASPGETPLLRRLLEAVTCYTTFLNAAEIYSAARGDEERRTVEQALFGLKILGASGRYAKTIGGVLSSEGTIGHRTAIVAAMARESNLPIVTETYFAELSSLSKLHVLAASELRRTPDRESLSALVAMAP